MSVCSCLGPICGNLARGLASRAVRHGPQKPLDEQRPAIHSEISIPFPTDCRKGKLYWRFPPQFVIIVDTLLKQGSEFRRARSSNTGHSLYHVRHEHVTNGNERIHRREAQGVRKRQARKTTATPRRGVRHDGLLAKVREPAPDGEPQVQGAQGTRGDIHRTGQGRPGAHMARGGTYFRANVDEWPGEFRTCVAHVPDDVAAHLLAMGASTMDRLLGA